MAKTMVNGIRIIVFNRDITLAEADSIVNAANRFLQHGGGVALALVRRGGKIIQLQSDDYISEHGPLKKGEVAVTAAGRLSAKRIIHTVGPVFDEGTFDDLVDAYAAAIATSDNFEDTILALPAVSSGTYGFSVEDSARALYNAIKRLELKNLREIRVYILNPEQYRKFIMTINTR
ncbi:MAG: macro domain-containing protein [Nitrososphaeria archaeon]